MVFHRAAFVPYNPYEMKKYSFGSQRLEIKCWYLSLSGSNGFRPICFRGPKNSSSELNPSSELSNESFFLSLGKGKYLQIYRFELTTDSTLDFLDSRGICNISLIIVYFF